MGSLNYASPIPQRRGFRLPFEIVIVSNTPLTPLKDIDDVALLFLTQIGYIPKGYDPKTDASSVRDSVPYRLFVECLLGRLDKGWTVEQLAAKLKTTKATIYRHINKLKEMDLLDEVKVTKGSCRGYATIGTDDAILVEPDESHLEVKGKVRLIPHHVGLAGDILEQVPGDAPKVEKHGTMYGWAVRRASFLPGKEDDGL